MGDSWWGESWVDSSLQSSRDGCRSGRHAATAEPKEEGQEDIDWWALARLQTTAFLRNKRAAAELPAISGRHDIALLGGQEREVSLVQRIAAVAVPSFISNPFVA